MLVLTRKKNEWIDIDGPCQMTVVEVKHDRVRLGFVAPESTRVLRTELMERLAAPVPHLNTQEVSV